MPEPEITDETLMLRYQNGEVRAFESLYGRHRGPLFRYLLRQCRNRALAEELCQDTWMRVVHARDRYAVQARFSTWLYRIAHNRVVDMLRRRHTAPPPLDSDGEDGRQIAELPGNPTAQPEHRGHLERQMERLMGLLDELPVEQCEVFVLREESGLSIEQIAEATGVNPETAKSRLRYAVQKLRRGLGESA